MAAFGPDLRPRIWWLGGWTLDLRVLWTHYLFICKKRGAQNGILRPPNQIDVSESAGCLFARAFVAFAVIGKHCRAGDRRRYGGGS